MNNITQRIVTAEQARKSAKLFSYGNIVAVLIPFPLFIFWFGASMLVYAFHRHHPNLRVGYYTQKAASKYYVLAGTLSVILLFDSGDFFISYGWILWILCILIIIPLSIIDIRAVNNEKWFDVSVKE